MAAGRTGVIEPFIGIGEVLTEVARSSLAELSAYLAGAMHDGTVSRLHGTNRIASMDLDWLGVIQSIVGRLGSKGWIYREGKARSVYVVEFVQDLDKRCLGTPEANAAYARGYFDAEGGIPRNSSARFYIQLVQKNRPDLEELRTYLQELGIECGKIHNPSVDVDPEYWRFYIRRRSQLAFAQKVGSWNPRKRSRLMEAIRPL
jgi:hypothetical protein